MFNYAPSGLGRRFFTSNPARTICMSFFIVIAVGSLLLMLPISSRSGQATTLMDALFTATSATCVTGLVVHDTYQYWSPIGQGVILILIQIGGLGLVTMATFFNLLVRRKLGLRNMDLAKESVNTDSFADVKHLVRTVIIGTFLVEAAGAVLLAFTFVPRFGFGEGTAVSVFTSISAFCNAGFDLLGRVDPYVSLTEYVSNWAITLPVMLLIILGGLGFVVWEDLLLYPRKKTLSLHSRVVLKMTAMLLGLGFLAFLIFEWSNPRTMGQLPFLSKINAALFQSVTCRTAGFNTVDLAALTDQSKILSIILMFVGASPAGTGGGIKVTTLAVVVMTIVCVMRGEEDTVIMKHRVEKKSVYRALALLTLGICMVTISSWIIHFSMDGQFAAIDVVFEEASAFGTVGLSAGVSPAASLGSRLVLILNMFLGRVGPLSFAISLAMRGNNRKEVIPTGKIIIG